MRLVVCSCVVLRLLACVCRVCTSEPGGCGGLFRWVEESCLPFGVLYCCCMSRGILTAVAHLVFINSYSSRTSVTHVQAFTPGAHATLPPPSEFTR